MLVTTSATSSNAATAASANVSRRDRWLFLSVHYKPDDAAWRAYATHTRRDPQALIAERATEEVALFFKTSAAFVSLPAHT